MVRAFNENTCKKQHLNSSGIIKFKENDKHVPDQEKNDILNEEFASHFITKILAISPTCNM